MKKNLLHIMIFIMVAGRIFAKENLAILPFTGGQGDEGETIAELFSFNDGLNDVFSPIPRTSITQAINREQRFQKDSGMTDADTIVAIGQQLGARYVVAGNITSIGNNKLLVIAIMDIRNLQQIAGDYQSYNNLTEIRGKLPNMASNIIQATQRNTATLPKLAIVPVQLHGDVDQSVADTLTQILAIHLIKSGKYSVYPRTKSLEQVMEEHITQLGNTVANSNIVGFGYGENPNLVLSVVARKLGDVNMFNAAIINLLTGAQVVGRSVDYRNINDGMNVMAKLAIDLTSTSAEMDQRQQEQDEAARRAAAARAEAERQAAEARKRREKWREIRDDERRFWSVGANIGSFYGVPALLGFGCLTVFPSLIIEDSDLVLIAGLAAGIPLGFIGALPLALGAEQGTFSPVISGNINTTLAPFPYSFLELGCDALFFNLNGKEGEDYLSFFPYANFLFFIDIGTDGYEYGGLYFGAGTGRMFTVIGSAERVNVPDLIHDKFTLNAIIGVKIGVNPHYFDLRAIGCFDFEEGFYFTMLLGYSFRF